MVDCIVCRLYVGWSRLDLERLCAGSRGTGARDGVVSELQ